MLISGLRPLKSRLQAKDNYVKKYCITDPEPEGVIHMAQTGKRFSPQDQHTCPQQNVDKSVGSVGAYFFSDSSDGADSGIIVL